MSSSKPTAQKPPDKRLLAPTLFVGPPSRNASSTSLLGPHGPTQPPSRAPLTRQRSYLRADPPKDAQTSATEGQAAETSPTAAGGLAPPIPAPFGRRQPATQPRGMGADHKTQARTDAAWTQMQNTLKDVELNATNGSHVFSERHARALDELRAAQIALAQAWGRNEAEESETRREEVETLRRTATQEEGRGSRSREGSRTDFTGGRPRGTSTASVKSVGAAADRTQLEEETENDIRLARKRREANDRYFQQVNAGVLDVVAKLEVVAKAMKGVEIESREIWGDTGREGESVASASAIG